MESEIGLEDCGDKKGRAYHYVSNVEIIEIFLGWLNRPLDAIDFWRYMETAVTRVTGMIPRDDDLKWATKVD